MERIYKKELSAKDEASSSSGMTGSQHKLNNGQRKDTVDHILGTAWLHAEGCVWCYATHKTKNWNVLQ